MQSYLSRCDLADFFFWNLFSTVFLINLLNLPARNINLRSGMIVGRSSIQARAGVYILKNNPSSLPGGEISADVIWGKKGKGGKKKEEM